MAVPTVVNSGEGGLTAAGTSCAVLLPGGGAATDEFIVIIAKGSVACTINALADWTELLDENSANGLAILRYTGAGIPSNPTFIQSSASRSVWAVYIIRGSDKTIAPQIGTTATGTSTTPNPPAVTVTGGPKDVLSIPCFAGAGELADTDTLVTTFPTGYTDNQREKTGGTGGTNLGGLLGASVGTATATSSVDPPTFTQNASRAWRAQTIVFHAIPPKQTTVARISLAAGGTPPTRTLHAIKVRARVTGGNGTIRAALYEGATNRSGDLESSALDGTLTVYALAIPDANAANITSYSDLEVRFWGYAGDGSAATFEIDQLWLETPEVTAPPPSDTDNFFAFI